MGVTAVGKSSVAAALSDVLTVDWIDADNLHPEPNIRKMSSGIPLLDEDRWPWLDEVGARLAAASRGTGLIVACSALRRSYRDRLRLHASVGFIHLTGPADTLRRRAQERTGHFMPPSLLDSQLSILEPLDQDERGVTFEINEPAHAIAERVRRWIMSDAGRRPPSTAAMQPRIT
ncbi:gluconokinase [Herbiconiux moechotypicola]|nr:gluconokinase [Herbiconiux moechotypicola]MCS5732006.1 gluconokinase [Herbiconiux moechotypicola]